MNYFSVAAFFIFGLFVAIVIALNSNFWVGEVLEILWGAFCANVLWEMTH